MQALLLAKAMEPYISQRAESLKRALRTLDPDGLHLKSADAAARFLQMWVALDSGDAKEEKEWEDALDSLPVNIDEQFPKSHFTYADMERYITLHRNIGGTTEIIDAGDVWLLRTTYPSQK